jgi:hypothetical protein
LPEYSMFQFLIGKLKTIGGKDEIRVKNEFQFLIGKLKTSTGIVTEVVDLCKSVLGLLSEFPLNVIVIGSLATVAFRGFNSS